jgi:hypothetical protein
MAIAHMGQIGSAAASASGARVPHASGRRPSPPACARRSVSSALAARLPAGRRPTGAKGRAALRAHGPGLGAAASRRATVRSEEFSLRLPLSAWRGGGGGGSGEGEAEGVIAVRGGRMWDEGTRLPDSVLQEL